MKINEKFKRRYSWVLFFLIVIIFLLVKINNLNYSVSDENTYLYMAKLFSDGKIPYKDFFYAHPILHLLLLAAIYKISGFNFIVFKLIPIIFIVISALFLFRLMKERFGDIEAFFSVILFLFSYEVLRVSTYVMDINFVVMLCVIGVYYLCQKPPIRDGWHDDSKANTSHVVFEHTKKCSHFWCPRNPKDFCDAQNSTLNHQSKIGGILTFKNKYKLSGLFFGLASITSLYSLIPISTIIIILLINNKKSFKEFSLSFFSIFILTNLTFIMLFGKKYIVPVYLYHLLKPASETSIAALFFRIFKSNALLFIGAFSFIFIRDKRLNIIAIITLIYILFLLFIQSVFGFYFLLLFPFLAILAGFSLKNIVDKSSVFGINKKITLFLVFLVIFISSIYSSYSYIKNESQNFNNAEEIAKFIAENSIKTDTIFGDDSTTPLIALFADRKIALDFADLNNLRFRSGVADAKEIIKQLQLNKNRFFMVYKLNMGRVTATYGMAYLEEFSDYINKYCKNTKKFSDSWEGYEKIIEIYEC